MIPYRPRQGIYARATAGGAAVALSLFASWRLFQILRSSSEPGLTVLGMGVPNSALWAAVMFVVLAGTVFIFAFGVTTGIGWLDSKMRRVVDLLTDTQSELAKVSWPSRDQLVRSTTAVLVSIALLGVFLLCVDQVIALLVDRFVF